MDDLEIKKQELIDICNERFNHCPDIKERLLSYIKFSVTDKNKHDAGDMIKTLVLSDSDIKNFDKSLIEIISKDIPVDALLSEVHSMPDNWLINQARQKNISYQKDTETITLVKGVPLYLGSRLARSYNSHVYRKTSEYDLYPSVTSWLTQFANKNNLKLARIAIVKLKEGGIVTEHIDYGDYYKNRDRYHLCLEGEYRYRVLDQSAVIKKGTLFRFNNKCVHEAVNTGTVPRICIIFDTEKLPVKNPQTPV